MRLPAKQSSFAISRHNSIFQLNNIMYLPNMELIIPPEHTIGLPIIHHPDLIGCPIDDSMAIDNLYASNLVLQLGKGSHNGATSHIYELQFPFNCTCHHAWMFSQFLNHLHFPPYRYFSHGLSFDIIFFNNGKSS